MATKNNNGGNENNSQPRDRQDLKYLSTRWYVGTFLGCLAFAAFLLWGLYQPIVRELARKNVEKGDLFFAHAQVLANANSNPGDELIELQQVDSIISEMIDLSTTIIPEERSLERIRKVKSLDQHAIRLTDHLRKAIENAGWSAPFAGDLEAVEKKARSFQELVDRMKNEPSPDPDAVTAIYGPLTTMASSFVTETKSLRDLFFLEQTYDRAMQQYMDALIIARLWTVPKMKLAELYTRRGWDSFAMEEYLKVIKLEEYFPTAATGGHGKQAFERLKEFEGKHPEADFRIAVGYLLYEDYDSARKHFRTFVEAHPANINAPKALEVLTHLEKNDLRYAHRYVNNEVWI